MPVTIFPPEPNGFLHLGHCKAVNFNFNYAPDHCYLRFDDTNPETEKQIYVDSVIQNIEWMGHVPYKITYASDYFNELYEFALQLINNSQAYVCYQTSEQIALDRKQKTDSPYRNRTVSENLELFQQMKNGKFAEGAATLRLKMNMKSNNPNMRDLVVYRIKYTLHFRTGTTWCIYPSYDYTHCICDSLEKITHSFCSMEFQTRNENYQWLLDTLNIYKSKQIEYSRINLTYTVLSKRKLIKLVDEKYVTGWDDPRMPTISGMQRRGYTQRAITNFCDAIGITKTYNVIKFELLEHALGDLVFWNL